MDINRWNKDRKIKLADQHWPSRTIPAVWEGFETKEIAIPINTTQSLLDRQHHDPLFRPYPHEWRELRFACSNILIF